MKLQTIIPATLLSIIAVSLPAAAGGDSACWKPTNAERTVLQETNQSRGEKGLPRLRFDAELSRVARAHSAKMMKNNSLYHNDKVGRQVTKWTILGENVGRGPSVDSVHEAFMNSHDHRANILRKRFANVGIGVKVDGSTTWITVVFEGKDNPGTTLRMPSCSSL